MSNYSDVEWTDGEFLTEQKLNQVHENTNALYQALEVVTVFTSHAPVTLGTFTATLAGTEILSFTDTEQESAQCEADINISAYGNGPLALVITADMLGTFDVPNAPDISILIFRPDEYDYMSIFFTSGGSGELTVILSEAEMGFNPL